MDYQMLADLLFPNVTDTPESLEERFPVRNVPEGLSLVFTSSPASQSTILKQSRGMEGSTVYVSRV